MKIIISIIIILFPVIYAVEEQIPEAAKTKFEEPDVFSRKKVSIKRLKGLFKKVDKNQDGFIDEDELISWNIEMAKNRLNKQIGDDFLANDYNKDGKLSWGELLNPIMGYTDESIRELLHSKDPADKDAVNFLRENKEKFDAVDIDGDEFLTAEEYKGLLNPYEYPKLLKYTTDKIMINDKDNDSHLNKEEFKRYFYVTEDPLTEYQQEEFDSIFKNYDFDKDGRLSRKEIEIWYAPDISIAAKIEASNLIEKSDKNGDSKLSVDEIIDNTSHWEDSQATNYGQHIRDEL